MQHARRLLLRIILAFAPASMLDAQSSPTPTSIAPAPAADFARERTLIEESEAARKASDHATARAKSAEAVRSLLARPPTERDAAWLALLDSVGYSAAYAQDIGTANAAWQRVLEIRSASLPDDHLELQVARQNLATTLYFLREFGRARLLFEKVLEVRSAALPDDHAELQVARMNLAETLVAQGDLAGARALFERVLEVYARTLPDDHPQLQALRESLAKTLYTLGDFASARVLYEKVLQAYSRTLPDDHPNLQALRLNLAAAIQGLGDVAGARVLVEQALVSLSRSVPDDDPNLQVARLNFAAMTYELGDVAEARALIEKVLDVYSRTLHRDHPDLQAARQNLATTLADLGDLAGARTLEEQVLEVRLRTLPDNHPELQAVRSNLAGTMYELGDFPSARASIEKVLEVSSRTLPDDHPELQAARNNLAVIIASQHARAAQADAREGEMDLAARETCADLIGAFCRAQVRAAREAVAGSPGREAEERCASMAKVLDVSLSFAEGYGVFEPLDTLESESFVLAETTRGAAVVSAELTRRATSAPEYGELRSALKEAGEELSGLAQSGATGAEFEEARAERESVEREMVALARELPGGGQRAAELDVESLAARLADREAAVGFRRFEKMRLDVVLELDSTGQPAVRETSVESLCAFVVRPTEALGPGESPLSFVSLGPIEPIDAAARAWRSAIGVGMDRGISSSDSGDVARQRGEELRRLVFDPLIPSLGDAERVIVALDDVLHLVPLDSLPLGDDPLPRSDSDELLGDRWTIETRTTLSELLMEAPDPTGSALVALGGASFNVSPLELSAGDVAEVTEEQPGRTATLLRGGAWERGFAPLTHTADEARGIGAIYAEIFDDERPVLVLEKRKASRAALAELAPRARFLHIATHGWFAPESLRSWSDSEPLDEHSGLGVRMSREEQVRGMSPMLLCGLALAGANLPEDAVGRPPGLVTAEEISSWNLSNCELAVLSACDTNVGERRAGQGVASLQKALQMAGARSAITSLWKVPDEATKDLMLDFYRRLWVEKEPKHRALWEAKRKLREAVDERGERLYTTRDWAAWVMTGERD